MGAPVRGGARGGGAGPPAAVAYASVGHPTSSRGGVREGPGGALSGGARGAGASGLETTTLSDLNCELSALVRGGEAWQGSFTSSMTPRTARGAGSTQRISPQRVSPQRISPQQRSAAARGHRESIESLYLAGSSADWEAFQCASPHSGSALATAVGALTAPVPMSDVEYLEAPLPGLAAPLPPS